MPIQVVSTQSFNRVQSFLGATGLSFFPAAGQTIQLARAIETAPNRPSNPAAIPQTVQGQVFDVRVGDPRSIGYRAPFVAIP